MTMNLFNVSALSTLALLAACSSTPTHPVADAGLAVEDSCPCGAELAAACLIDADPLDRLFGAVEECCSDGFGIPNTVLYWHGAPPYDVLWHSCSEEGTEDPLVSCVPGDECYLFDSQLVQHHGHCL